LLAWSSARSAAVAVILFDPYSIINRPKILSRSIRDASARR
jgi:hypothetical protein